MSRSAHRGSSRTTPKRELLVWRTRRTVRSLGWSGVAGLVGLVFAAGYYFLEYLPLAKEVTLKGQATEFASVQMEQSGYEEEVATPLRQLDEFYSRLKRHDDVPEVVRDLHRGARAAGLSFVRGDYRPQRDASGKLLRYQITLPVVGSYPKVRRFLAQAMRAEPALALDGVSFQTDQSGGRLETRVQFTLFVSADGARSTIERANDSRSTVGQANDEPGSRLGSADGARSNFESANGSPLTSAEAQG